MWNLAHHLSSVDLSIKNIDRLSIKYIDILLVSGVLIVMNVRGHSSIWMVNWGKPLNLDVSPG